MTEKQEKLIDESLDELGVSDIERRNDFKKFALDCGMFNPNVKWFERTFGTKANIIALYKKLDHPIKRTSKILGLEYKELAEKIGYSERGLKNAILRDELSLPMKKAITLLVEKEQYKKRCEILENKLKKIENTLSYDK